VTEEFATLTPVLAKDPKWIADISEFFNAPSAFGLISDYFTANPDVDKTVVERNIQRLADVKNAQIGIINLADDLDVETVSGQDRITRIPVQAHLGQGHAGELR
jgi:hypothetical protein